MRIRNIRWGAGIIFLVLGILFYFKYTNIAESDSMGQLKFIIISIISFICMVFVFLPDIISILSSPANSAIESIISPNEKLDKPPLNYKLADFYVKEERFDEAIEEYEKIIKYYPKEEKPYLEIFDIQLNVFKNFDDSKTIIKKGLAQLGENQKLKSRYDLIKNSDNSSGDFT